MGDTDTAPPEPLVCPAGHNAWEAFHGYDPQRPRPTTYLRCRDCDFVRILPADVVEVRS